MRSDRSFGVFSPRCKALCWVGLFSLLSVSAFAQTSASDPKEIFAQNCVMCHGPDGAGTPMGKRMGVADLRSAEVQKQANSALEQVVSNGRNNMPAFKTKLSADQISSVIKYIRTLRK